jgi:FdhD protein
MIQIPLKQLNRKGATEVRDWVAVEEPLEVRIQGVAYAVLLRTPGDEPALVAGFLVSEGILAGPEDLRAIAPCTEAGKPNEGVHVWNVGLADGVSFDPGRRRVATVGSTCGLCGVSSMDELRFGLPALDGVVAELGDRFFEKVATEVALRQTLRKKTSGVHAAAIALAASGEILEFAEDVGRHNAVDKVIGARFLDDDFPLEGTAAVLWVSGRISFEIVQKAALAGLSVLVGIGVPTTLALAAANQVGMTLFGRARPDSINRYCGLTSWAGH